MNTTMDGSSEFLMERALMKQNQALFHRFQGSVSALTGTLSSYQRFFPTFTDHSVLHSLNVIDFCNRIMGAENLRKLNEDEIYCLLMGCYLHDAGMGIRVKDYYPFLEEIKNAGRCPIPQAENQAELIRRLHHEFSGRFIFKYGPLFDIPSPDHILAIAQISRGHRKTDLYDPEEYPVALPLPNGNTVCLPYLTALIRLADEIDVAADRNPSLLYDLSVYTDERDIRFFSTHEAIRTLQVNPESFTLFVHTDQAWVMEEVIHLRGKMQETLDYCRDVVARRTPFEITQQTVEIREI